MKNKPISTGRKLLCCLLILASTPLTTNVIALNYATLIVLKTLQQNEVRGQITDNTGMPLAGVTIVIKGTRSGTTSDFNGSFSIYSKSNDVLIFSFVGYKTQEVAINGRSKLDIQLEPDITALNTVEINAGYYTVKDKERTGNISRITAKDIEKNSITNPLAAIQGRMPGVEITQTSGIPGTGFSIKIRGQNSIRAEGSDPLYIVDGIPYASSPLGDRQVSGAIIPDSGFSPLNTINSNNIESLEVLKDADATAIYGSRGANGVVLITTKKGKNTPLNFNLDLSSGLGSIPNNVSLLNTPEYISMREEAFKNDGINSFPANAYDVNGTWNRQKYTNWQKELFGKTAYLNNIQAGLSGGNGKTRFLINGGYNRQTTVLEGDFENKTSSFLASINHKTLNDKLAISFSTNYTNFINILPPTSLVREAMLLPPNAPDLYNDDGSLNWENSTWNNPLRHSVGKYQANGNTLIGNLGLTYQITNSLKFKTNMGYTESSLKEIRTSPHTQFNPAYGLDSSASSATHNNTDRASWIIEPQLDWHKGFNNSQINALVGLTFQEEKNNKLSLFARGFTNNNFIENRAAANSLTIFDDSQTQYRYNAFFGRINFNHKSKYLLNITGRRDGSSRFGTDKKFANFYAIGAAWIFSNEAFIEKSIPFLSFGKLRGSYGTSGNDQIGDYQYLDTYSFSNSQYQNIIGMSPTRLFNPDFSWEKNTKKEIALELGFLNDRISFSSSYYQNVSSNQLVGIPLPGITGFSSLNANLNATVKNSGWEFQIHSVNIRNNSFNWETSLNFTLNENKLLEFPDLEGSTYVNTLVIGESLNILKLYESKGVNPQTGLFEFVDFNNDGIISAPYDKQVVKDLNPKYYGGLNNSISYGKFNLEFLLQFTKQEGLNYLATGNIVGTMNNQPQEVLGRWQNPGDQTDIQQFTSGANRDAVRAYSNFAQSDAAICDASYIRLKTLSISFDLTSLQTQKFGCNLFLLGQNLLTLSNYNGLDPETRTSNTIPPLRFISIGSKFTF
ncbi:SusC/RagA family TonB-linked outer membrane protein [Pseudotamlana agarivorans]|uniref:SusC/RagA family TonB-linked outer membrane protein n=1 Tax=Pseudotamlana agarivorans TaxID=481183 RepID=UPI00082B6C4E|nr:SusC/RagA family TonB-linked outer membrane protein [Tamlana agarivorans]